MALNPLSFLSSIIARTQSGKIAYNADDDLDNLCELWVMNADGSNQ